MEGVEVVPVEADSDISRLLKSCAFQEADRVPSFEHYLMGRSTRFVLGEARAGWIAQSEEMIHMRYLYSDEESESRFRDSLLRDPEWARRSPAISAHLPPSDNLGLLRKTGVDAATLLLNWLPRKRRPHGAHVRAQDQDGTIKGWKDLGVLRIPDGRVEKMMALVDWYAGTFRGTGVGVGALARSCLCNSYEILGIENFMLSLYDDMTLVQHVMDVFTDYACRITSGLADREIDCFWLDDDIAGTSGLLVSPQFLRKHWMPRTERILQPLQRKGVPIYMHCCGNLTDVIPLALDLGVSAMHPVQPNCNDIYALRKQYDRRMAFIGNADLAGVLRFGTPQEVASDTREHIERLSPGGGYVVASSHSITDDIPPENYIALVEAAQHYGRRA